MDNLRKVYKPRKPTKIHRKIKIGSLLCKNLKKTAKLFKILKPLFRKLFPAAVPQQPLRHDDPLAFMTCIIKVNASKSGWQKAVLTLLRNCKGARFKMDQNGVVEVSGIADPNQLLKKIGRSSQVELHWFQFGQCSSNLFMPESKKNPVQEKPNTNNHLPYSYNNSFPLYMDYGYHYPQPNVFKTYAPY